MLVEHWSRSGLPVAGDVLDGRPLVPVHELVEEWARRVPDEIAVVSGTTRLTFAELDGRAEALAAWLRESGAGPEVPVGVLLGRGVDLVVAFMAVLKTGGVYVPLNVGQPVDRLAFMLDDCGAGVLVSSTALAGGLPEFGGPVLMIDRLNDYFAQRAATTGAVKAARVSLDGLAYVAFTSGSTGRPKGVAVSHRGLAGYVAGWGEVFGRLGGAGVMLSMAGSGFDVSVGDIVRGLCFGRAVVFTPQSDFVSVAELHQVLEEHQVEVAEIVPGSLLRELAGYCRDAGGLKHLRLVISGTDIWRYDALVSSVADVAPVAVPANVYGVTEASIDSLLMPLVAGERPEPPAGAVPVDASGLMVPVGRPLAGVRVYVVDDWLNVVPVGVAGELLIGGVGLARGYVGRAGLTSERFVADHLGGVPGERLYRTGDRVRWRADGMLEFLGRTDEQVKIRGFRVEPGEIENVLAEHPDVQEAAVVARDDGPNGKRLVGYVVAESGTTVEVSELRVFLRARLPEYMVPAVLMVVEGFTLTANGKVDRRALPEPDVATIVAGVEYVPPRTEAELVLAGIWSQVLGVERVGVQDNFFELGGDSILSLQIVARARAAGLRLDVADVFASQTVGTLAAAARKAPSAVLAEQGTVTGPVEPTPIQHWFTKQDVADRDHWNWSGVFELAPGVDAATLGRALGTVVAHHDALRLRFRYENDTWVQENAAEETTGLLDVVDAAGLHTERAEALVTERMTTLQKSLSLADGPLLRAAYFDRGDQPSWLGVTVHHLAMDGVSWNILLEDLDLAYRAIRTQGSAKGALAPKTTSYRQWAGELLTFAASTDVRDELGYWLAQLGSGFEVPVDRRGTFDGDAVQIVRVELDAEATSALLTRVHRAYRTQINDVLLAGLLQALGRWAGTNTVTIDLESHGREAISDGVDLSRTVGWFTSIFPVALSGADLDDPAGVLKSVKEQLRAVPRRGVGYGALRHLTEGDDAALRRLRNLPGPQVLFNYIGGADVAGDESVGLVARELPAELAGPTGETGSHPLQIEAFATAEGRMAFEWYYSPELHDTATVERVAHRHVEALRALIEHCLSPEAGGHTPSDFPLATLDQDAVDTLTASAAPARIEDVYRLAPVQQGMLFHVLEAPEGGAGVYWAQGIYEVGGHRVDPELMRRAWDTVAERHTALRTGFVWQGVPEPVQVVHDGVRVPFEYLDWSRAASDRDRQTMLERLLNEDRAKGFDVARPPLTRVYLIDRGEQRYWMIWALYQGICDGWSLPVVMEDVAKVYEGLRDGTPARLPAVRPYRDFIEWLGRGDAGEVEGFWREYLAGFEAPTPLPVDRQAADHWAQDKRQVVLSQDETAALTALARRARVTLGTVVQAVWALLLSRHSGERDVMFGLTVSGRPAELTGMESIVGLFINTLPLRVTVPADTPFVEWLRTLQDNQVAVQRYEYTPLSDIQRYSVVPRGASLFHSIMVFGNYPQEELPADLDTAPADDGFLPTESLEQGNYPLTFAVDLVDRLSLEVEFSTAAFEGTTIDRLLDRFATTLRLVAADATLPPREIGIVLPGERERLTGPWSRSVPLPDGALVPAHELVRRHAARNPGGLAVVCGDESLTFAELDARADLLARWLRASGVTAEVPVGVVLGRGVDLVVAFMAVLRAGGVYVPLNLGQPAERLAFMLEECGARVLVSGTGMSLPPFDGPVLMTDRLDEQDLTEAVPVDVSLDGLAYVCFTSGSTGRPKGVGVTHRGLAGYVAGWGEVFERLGGAGSMLSMAGAGFDVSVGDIVRAVCFGKTVVFTPQSDFVSVAELHQVLAAHEVEIAEIVPGTLLRELAGYCRESGGLDRLRLVISGTDIWRYDALVSAVAEVAPSAIPANVYGVTEAAIDSLLMPLVSGAGLLTGATAVDAAGLMVPIGRPLAGVRVYVVDEWLNVVPAGVTGELLIGGVGVARGYVGRAGLTSERFVADHLSGIPGERLYRTGDRVRWRADGMLEFLGRTDEQVKIRGFRVEPGEIENVLAEHPDVQDAAVVARDDGPNGKRLVGYVVTDTGLDTGELRAFLRARLPEYMVPAVLMVVEAFTLTANGKVDRRALPEPDVATVAAAVEYVPPRTHAETVLAGIWSQVLGVERVGVQDNFFELGGDSILSLQIVARARAAGLQLDVADVFARQSIEALAAAVRQAPAVTLAEQGTVTGPVPLTPIQHWFTRQDIADRDHWNWSGMFELAPRTDAGLLSRAVDALVAHHDALRLRFSYDATLGEWTQVNAATEPDEVFHVVDAAGLDQSTLEDLVTTRMTAIQGSLSLAGGPLLRVVLFERGPEPGWLGITAHHLVMDGVSWNILLEDLHRVYEVLARGGRPQDALGPKTTSFRQWAEELRTFAASPGVRAEAGYWLEQLESAADIPLDGDGVNSEESGRTIRVELDAETTSALLTRVHKAYRTQINDVLLAGLLRALGRWAGADAVAVDLESHGREAITEGVDLSRTVGWFTSIFPVALSGDDLDDLGGLLKSVKEQLRRTPRRGVGYGALRYLTDADASLRRLRDLPGPRVLFNYTGGADVAGDDSVGLLTRELPADLCGPTEGEEQSRSHALQIEAFQTAEGRMAFEWYYSVNLHDAATVERVARDYADALRELVEHCLSPEAGGHTPSDFPLATLDQAAVDMLTAGTPDENALTGQVVRIGDVYPLAPVQQGMLFHVLQGDSTGVYWAQGLYELAGHLVDPAVLRQAWNTVLDRHDALRTGFVWQGVPEPVQVVHDGVGVPFEVLDWSATTGDAERQALLDDLLRQDRERGFDLARPPLMRVYLIDRGDQRYWMIWALYQGICDGWSLPVVMDEVFLAYEALRSGEPAGLPAVRPYRDFIEWLQDRRPGEAEEFWRRYLAGFEAPTPLPVDRRASSHWAQDKRRVELPVDVTSRLVELSRRARVTLGTVVQAAWGLMLSRFSGEADVMFGLTVSGRPAELAGMESIVGLFINTLPMRMDVPGDVPFEEWLQRLQDNQVELQRYEYTPLVDIQRYSSVPRGSSLFESIMVFGNYPEEAVSDNAQETGDADGDAFASIESFEQGNYPLTFAVDLRARLEMEVEFSTAAFDGETVDRLLDRFAQVLGTVADDPSVLVRDIDVVLPGERDVLVAEWSRSLPVADDALVPAHELVRDWARRTPDAVAVVCGEARLTFAELDSRAGALASSLRSAGVTAEVPVGVLLGRGVDLVVAFMAVLRAGGVYVPLNLGQPADRLGFMLEECGARVLVTSGELAGGVPAFDGTVLLAERVEAADFVPAEVSPDGLAYVCFTSGSTGRPKGVGVTHRGLAGYVAGWGERFERLGGAGSMLSMAGAGFDVSVGDIVRAVCFGKAVVFTPQSDFVSVAELHDVLATHSVEIAEIVPGTLLRELAGYCRESGGLDKLRLVISGTDIWRYEALVSAVADVAPEAVPANVYGVTEAAIDSLLMPLVAETLDTTGLMVPIGRPLAGVRVYVVDPWLKLVPAGVAGELLIGGVGVARGYVGRAGLTSERFVADHLSGIPGERLYRTGDRVRWRADGMLEFLGRTDEQVKIRGYRVEPGEIENVLAEHASVQDAAVVARDDGPNGKRLVGYVVPEPGATADTAELRAFLRARLPEYMVPAVLMTMDTFPLTANGKVDRRALPEPDVATIVAGVEYVPPRTEAELVLAGIWSQVLGVERVGVQDNFFELGGDSILSLQIVARARAAGLQLDVADVFAHQSIGALAGAVRRAPAVTLAEQGTVEGPVPLTPIQHWFTQQDIADRDHWNWSGVFELAPGVDPAVLSRAVKALVAHHDALRIRFAYDADTWTQSNAADEPAEIFTVVDATAGRLEALVTDHMTVLQRSLSLAEGPLLRVAYFDRGDAPSWLGVTVHHLVMDGVAWNILLEDLHQMYEVLARGGTPDGALAPKTTSFRQWAEQLQIFAASGSVRGELDYWLDQLDSGFQVPVDGAGVNCESSGRTVQVELDAETTSALLTRVHRAYRTQINDVLLAGLLQALGRWAGTNAVTIDLESHGREAITDGVDLSRTVGWFTSIFPVALSGTDLNDPAGVLKSVKEQLRGIPRRGVGYGALRHLTEDGDAALRRLRNLPGPQVLFNYTGGADVAGDDSVGLLARELPADLAGPTEGDEQTRSHVLQIEVSQSAEGRMVFEWYYSANLHDTATVERVAQGYLQALRELAAHCLSPQAGGNTPSDFPLARLDQASVDLLAAGLPVARIQDVYPLAPVQQGMLFHVIEAPADGAGVYWAQGVYELGGHRVDPEVMRQAWDVVVERHDALRTGFVWQGVAEPVQVVHEGLRAPFEHLDWSGLDHDDAARQARLERLLQVDRDRGFDLARPPLMRVYLVDRGDGRYWLIWSLYQGICDGWSLPIVMDELSLVYEALRRGERAELAAVRPYRDFIAWLQGRDAGEVERYWREYLAGFEAPTALPLDRQAGEHWAQDRRKIDLTPEVTAALVDVSRRARVTLGTVVQAAWALLLSRYSGDRDVTFGLTVSGRPAELTGMESIVGLFINTLPMRVDVPDDVPFIEWLRHLQDNQVGLRRYEFTPLVDVQRYSAVPRGTALFDSILVFGNYPEEAFDEGTDPAGEEGGLLAPVENVEQGHYPMTVMVDLEDRLGVEIAFSTSVLDAATVERVLVHLSRVLGEVAADPAVRPAGIDVLEPGERATLTAPVAEPARSDESIVSVFARRVRERPDAVAVGGDGGSLTYAELDARANRLAHLLVARGAEPGRLVAVTLPRTVDLVVALLGVVKSGAGYLPIPPDYPADRVAFMLEDAAPVATVTEDLLAESASYPAQAPEVVVGGRDVAYVIYTSGSTGRPKGVMIEHANVIRLLTSTQKWFSFGADDVWTMFHSAAFDFSVWELWGALLWGGKVVVVSFDTSRSPSAMLQLLADERVTVLNQTPSAFYQLTAADADQADIPDLALRYVVFGGEALEVARLSGWRERHPDVSLINMYGITETTVHVSYLVVDEAVVDGAWRGSPIGVPIEDLAVYVLDECLRPAPIGVPGEMYVAGAGLARGYLGRAGLTSTRFVADHVSGRPGERLYRTGDRARWRADGTLEYLGRTDDQVKIRGFRIEPGEIENVLAEHPNVAQAVVVARDEGTLGKRLIGYTVPRPGTQLEVADLRSFVRGRLPEYMVPAVFMIVESFSLTSNGKIDRRALPEPDAALVGAIVEYVPPRTEAERTLAGIWSEVLGVERVGALDNFFELGGDSILSLQIVARARAAGLQLEVADVFAHQTIGELAAAVRDAPAAVLAEQGSVTGPVPLTPAARWFTAQESTGRDHWNRSGVLELTPGTDPRIVGRALEAVVAHHDGLRLRLAYDTALGEWTQSNADAEPVPFTLVDATGLDQAALEELVTGTMTGLQRSLSLTEGPLLRVACFDRGDQPAWLGVVAHRLVADATSWGLLLQDLDRAYQGILAVGTAEGALPAKTTSVRQWSEHLRGLPEPQGPDQVSTGFAVPVDSTGDDTEGSSRTVRVWLDAGTVAALRAEAHQAYRTRDDDLLVAALVQTLGAWTGTSGVTVDVAGDGRDAAVDGIDLSRTTGWFPTAFPVRASTGDPAAVLKSVKEQMRAATPWRIVTGDRQVLFSRAAAHEPSGIVARVLPGTLAGPDAAEGRRRTHVLHVEVVETAGGVALDWHYSGHRHNAGTVQRLADQYAEAVRRLVEHCLTPGAGGYTPSDFPLAGLTQAELDTVAAGSPPIADMYPLTPVQQGMLFHTLEAPEDASGVYWAQELREYSGVRMDADAMRRAWDTVVERHAVLRTRFVWEGVAEPLQVVHPPMPVPFELLDWSDTTDTDVHQRRLEDLLRADRDRGFDVTTAPLMRVYVMDLGGERYWMVWTFHHVVMDGWSVSIVMDEVSQAYEALRQGEPAGLPAVRPYRDFIAWLRDRDPAEAERFWREYLAGFEAPTPLPVDRQVAEHWGTDYHIVDLSAETTAALERLARRARVTVGTVVQAGWALLLSRYSGEPDVMFGLTVSGRPAELSGMESIVGLFINTLPLRATVPADVPFIEWLRRLQDNQLAVQRFEYSPLLDIQRYSPIPRGASLFDSILAFQNLPVEGSEIEGQQDMSAADAEGFDALLMFEQGRYPLMFSVDMEEQLAFAVEFSTSAFDKATIVRLFDQYLRVLTVVADNPEILVRDVPLQSKEEQRRMLVAWNETATAKVPRATLPEMFQEQVRLYPDKVAVRSAGEEITYAELDRRAAAVAGMLRRTGVAALDKVGLHFERGIEYIVAMMGVTKAGAVYVPLDPSQPDSRLSYMVGNSGIGTVITNVGWPEALTDAVRRVHVLDDVRDGDEDAATSRWFAEPDDLLYAMYTSGSSGLPKGVEVTHEAVARICRDPIVVVEPDDVLSHIVPISFDASTFEIWGALANGATLAIASADQMARLDLVGILWENKVTVSVVTSGLFHQVAETAPEVLSGLRMVLCGGDALSVAHCRKVKSLLPDLKIINAYGPTETTIACTMYDINAGLPDGEGVVSIGGPLSGRRVYVLDEWMNVVPVGVAGELFVGGAGVARGYVGRPDLTAERFVADVVSGVPGDRLYRTGDRVRWRADGMLEFLGRVDDQVKIRGFRIELAEVEAALNGHPRVRDSVVVAREDGASGKRLVGYVVYEEADGEGDVLGYMRRKLPEYMVPALIMPIAAIPVTPNGKVDRRALPEPDWTLEQAAEYVPPVTEVEVALAEVWAQVLGLERIGLTDNFFELGGDSILSLQIVAKAKAAGLKLKVADLFTHQTIGELAPVVEQGATAVEADQGQITGAVPLTPIQHWWAGHDIADRDHWNWSGLFELTPGTDSRAMEATLATLLEHHDALRMRFTQDPGTGTWYQHNAPHEDAAVFAVYDAAGLDQARLEELVTERMTAAQTSLDLAGGPVVQAVYFDRGEAPAWLGIVAHHLVMDMVSWNVLLEDLDLAYQAITATGTAEGALAPKTTSFQRWAEALTSYAATPEVKAELPYWTDQLGTGFTLPVDDPTGTNTEATTDVVEVELDAESTTSLLTRANRAYGTQTAELLIAAFAHTLGEWTDSDKVTLDLENHGREDIAGDLDLTRTVGWFTSVYPVTLTATPDLATLIPTVRDHLRTVPHRGVGYGTLRHLTDPADPEVAAFRALPVPSVSYNYLGGFDAVEDDTVGLLAEELPGDLCGPTLSGNQARAHILQIEATQSGEGTMVFEWNHSTSLHTTETITRIATRYIETLKSLITHCLTKPDENN
nr:non-ribosomal peptide synthase/polyketide synthase [Sphaerisporangium rubeum]